ncbi:hypothetical protein JOM56_008895 [Amanita muscaria]
MLAARSETPRPRPPAKARRSTSTNRVLRPSASSPPPSYADSFGEARGLAHSTTEGILSSRGVRFGKQDTMDSDDPWGLRGADEEQIYRNNVMDDEEGGTGAWGLRSPPELVSEMLDRAHDIFREREHDEVGSASAACRSLYEETVALQNKHQTLSGRMQQTASPEAISPSLPTPLFSTPPRGYYTYSHSTPERLSDLSRSHPRQRPSQRLSMSTSDVAYLADQNSELLEKLERLEQDSSHADQSGRRQLKRLEKEIAELREELEKTQARSEELEEKTKRGWNSEQVINAVARKKLEREAKMKALKNLGQGSESSDDTEVKSFAPEGSRFGGPSPGYSFMTPSRRVNSSVVIQKLNDDIMRSTSSPFPSQPAPEQEPADRPEITLINKLMEKMTELQEANAHIIEQQAETTMQLHAFHKETEQMNKMYHSLGAPFEMEDTSDSEHNRTGLTRFHSFSDFVENRSFRSVSAKKRRGSGRNRRKTLGGNDAKSSAAAAQQANASAAMLSLPVPFPPSPTMDRHHSCSSLHDAFASPALSLLSLETAAENLEQPSPLPQTLQSELGDALNVGHGDGNDFHIRSTSIFDLSGKRSNISIPPSPSPSPGHLQAYRIASDEDSRVPSTPMSLGPRANSLLLHPEGMINEIPATPAMDNRPTLEFTSPGLQSPRYYRMSQTVRSRTDRWAKGRFTNSLVGTLEDIPEPPPPAALGVSQRLAQAFESVIDGIRSPGSEAAATAEEGVEPSGSSSGRSSVASVYEDATLATESPTQEALRGVIVKERQGLGKVVLELWLWLQFVVIIVVFLWAMARKGPKAVLFEGDGKRVLPGRR